MNNKLNYPNWLVPLDIAQELKAIGFDEPCHFHFLYYHGWEMLKKRGDEYGFITSNNCRAYVEENHNGIGNLSVPTWEQVFAWFRKQGYLYAIENEICYDFKTRTQPPKIKYTSYFETVGSGVKLHSCTSESYEEAREELVKDLIYIYSEELLE